LLELQIIHEKQQHCLGGFKSTTAVSFITHEPKTNTYRLKIGINNPKPVNRFVLGLLDDVEVIGSIAFKDYLKNYVFVTLENNKSDFEN